MNIPQPRSIPILKNVLHLDFNNPVQSLMRLSQEYGEVVRMEMPNSCLILLGTQSIAAEVCDESRFHKIVGGPLEELRDLGGDGLFTAYHGEPNWALAHKILLPAFGPLAMRDYYEEMLDLTLQLVEKWERQGSHVEHDVADEMTRLTLDTIALCGFGIRLNSFYHDKTHPFIHAMLTGLKESLHRSARPKLLTKMMVQRARTYDASVHLMNQTVDEVIQHRRQTGETGDDLLGRMLAGVDPDSGEGLSDINIRYQILTFLIAGHETTSGLLSFAIHFLMNHPQWMERAQQEVDEVLGADPKARLKFEDLPRLEIIDRVFKETLRLWPTAPVFSLTPYETTRIGQGYEIHPGERLGILIPRVHRDPEVWDRPEVFDPDRFLPEREAQLPPQAYTPFGYGMRACIGRRFALQEAKLAMAMLLHRFELQPDPDYTLRIKETLTLKPDALKLRAVRRTPSPKKSDSRRKREEVTVSPPPSSSQHNTPMLILYGSNMGSTEHLARNLGDDAKARGYDVTLKTLDEATRDLPQQGVVAIMSASYNGHPPDNAAAFCDWVTSCPPDSLADVSYFVFGCGSKDWAQTYQEVPRLIDAALEKAGAQRLLERGEADAAADLFGDIDQWSQSLWPALENMLQLDTTPARTLTLRHTSSHTPAGYETWEVLEVRSLVDTTQPNTRDKVHIQLRARTSYQCGDQLSILARTSLDAMERLAKRLDVHLDDIVLLQDAPSWMPQDTPLHLRDLLRWYIDLSEPVTRRALRAMIAATPCPPEAATLQRWLDDYDGEVVQKHRTLVDSLESIPGCQLTLEGLLEVASSLRPRLYTIASAPEHNPDVVELTVSVDPLGHCSRYLANLKPGDMVPGQLKTPSTACQPVEDLKAPVIMIAAGSGIAAHRALLQWRAAHRPEGEAHLFFGCNAKNTDYLYAKELHAWEEEELVHVHTAFSREPGDVRYVQHRLAREAELVQSLLKQGAQIYVCGDGKHMGPAVRSVLDEAARDAGLGDDWGEIQIASGRYINDVWAG